MSVAYLINPSHQCVGLYVYPSYRCKVTTRFSVSLLSLLGNVSVKICLGGNEHTRNNKKYWTRRFLCGPCRIKGDSVGLSVYPPIVARQRLGKDVPTATEKCWTRRFLCGPCRIKGDSVGLSVYPPIVARQRLGKDVPTATEKCWRRRFLCGPCRIKRKLAISSSQNFFFHLIY
jgi:hypothetical protein